MSYDIPPYEQWIGLGKTLDLDDGQIFYVHKGQGFPVIFIHFYGGNSWWFSRVIDKFADQYSVYAPDLPGCGQSDTPVLPYDVPDMASSVLEFMDSLGIEYCHLIGIGGGSMTCVEIAARDPSRVKSLILEVLPHWTRDEAKEIWLQTFRPQFLDGNGSLRPMRDWTDMTQRFPGLSTEERSLAFQRMESDFMNHGDWWMTILTCGQLRYDVSPNLMQVQAPTLLLNGELAATHLRHREKLIKDSIKNSRLVIIPKCGLPAAFEQPNQYSEISIDFLCTVDGQS